jgi:hypothetical protein
VERELIAPLVGFVVVAIGLGLMRWHFVAWNGQQSDPSLTEAERRLYERRYRRRMQTSGLLAVLGVLLGLGDVVAAQQVDPLLFAAWIIAMLLLVCWIILLALGDMASTAVHSRQQLARVRQEQRALELRLEEMRNRRANGQRPEE